MYKNNQKGISLIEMLISIFILATLSLGIFSLFQMALKVIAENKARTGAVSLANEKLELIRNLSYEDVGTIGGTVSGILEESEDITRNNVNYSLETDITCAFDDFDGLLPPEDAEPCDYKLVKITVSWLGHLGQRNLVMKTAVAPRGLETSTGGVLKITVFDANGDPVPQADVHIVNNDIDPPIDTTHQTNDDGVLLEANLEESMDSYEITVTKSGYSTDMTCAINTETSNCIDGNPNPTKPHASVLEGEVTEISFAIDLVSTLTINTINQTVPDTWTVSNGDAGTDQDNPAIAVCDNGDYVFAWRDYSDGQGKIASQRYDQNQTQLWGDDKYITTASNQNNVDLAVDDSCNVYAVWQDDRNGNLDIYFDSFDSNGDSRWGGSKKIETEANNKDQTRPKIILNATSSSAYVVWQDNRSDDSDIFIKRFNDLSNSGGPNTLWSPEIKVNTNIDLSTQAKPVITIDDGNNTYIAWQDARDANYDIYAQKLSSDGQQLWSDTKINTDSTITNQLNPDIAIDSNDNIYIVWQDERNGDSDIYIQKYDSARTLQWTSGDIRVNSDTGTASQENPAIAISSTDKIYIVWQDYRNSDADIYLQILDAAGNKLLANDLRIADDLGDQENPDIVITPSGYPTITWQDNTPGDWDIKAAQFSEDLTIITQVANVPLTITGAKTIGSNPVIYKYILDTQTDASGTLNLSQMEWDTYTIEVGDPYTLLSSDPPIPFLLNPNASLTVTLNVE